MELATKVVNPDKYLKKQPCKREYGRCEACMIRGIGVGQMGVLENSCLLQTCCN